MVRVFHVKPFSEAVRACFKAAIAERVQWLVTIDADLLVVDSLSSILQRQAGEIQPDQWQALGLMDCKLGGVRRGGVRLYRVAGLVDKLQAIDDKATRPESELCKLFPQVRQFEEITAFHDYEQWLADLHRKGDAHRFKHSNWRKTGIISRWKEQADSDPDFKAALQGWRGKPLTMPEKPPL